MKILVHDYPGHPFQVDLSRSLARFGYEVQHLYAGYNVTPRGALNPQPDDPSTFNISPVFIQEPLQKYSFIKRWRQEREYGQLLADRIREYQPDVVISSNTPLDAQRIAQQEARNVGAKFIFWLQDVIGIASHRILKNKLPIAGDLIGRYYIDLEKTLLRQSDHIVLITEDFEPLMKEWGIDGEMLSVIPNWAPIDQLPVHPKKNSWSEDKSLQNGFNFMYTGTLGMKHNPNLLLRLAAYFKDTQDLRIIVISEGPGAGWLARMKEEHGLTNLLLMEYQPFEQLPEVMASADVLIALLEKDAGFFSVPSKVLTYLCSQRPLLLAVPENNLAAKIVAQNNAGIVTQPEDIRQFIDAAVKLFNDESLREIQGQNGRKYAETHFGISGITEKFVGILNQPNR